MQAMLMNFGDGIRVIRDAADQPLSINIGEVVNADIHDLHFTMIKNAVKTDTLMVVPQDCEISDKLKAVVDVLRIVETDEYDIVLRRFNEAVPYDEDNGTRPSRHRMRTALRDLARYEVAMALHAASKVSIREEGDAETRKEAPAADTRAPGDLPASPPNKTPASRKKTGKQAKSPRARERL